MKTITEVIMENSDKIIKTTIITTSGIISRISYVDHESGKFHRADGPAIEYNDGEVVWAYRGVYHRIGGPALYNIKDGSLPKKWYFNGKSFNSQEEYFDNIPAEYQDECIFSPDFFSN